MNSGKPLCGAEGVSEGLLSFSVTRIALHSGASTAMPALTAVRRSDRIAPMDGANAVMIAGDTARGLEGDLFSMHPIEELLILAWAAKYVMCGRHASRSVATLFSH